MPLYEYYCRECAAPFDKLRPISAAVATASCPRGHANAERTISLFAPLSGRATEPAAAAGSGGCCGGGGCACSASRN